MTDPELADPRPLTAGVMGHPITHSKSPLIFEHWFAQSGIAGRYCHISPAPQDFEQVYRGLSLAGFRGVNVTVPFKLEALALADTATDTARRVGAANMIAFRPDGSIHADNTDGYGFMQNLWQAVPAWLPASGPATVLGAGGASRAILVALIDAGVPEIRLINRSIEKAERLAAELGDIVKPLRWSERAEALSDTATLVNTTSLGMAGQPPLDIALDLLPQSVLVSDIVYTPLQTDLLERAKKRGNRTVDGLGMLLHQARPAFRTWFGTDPAVDEALRQVCLG